MIRLSAVEASLLLKGEHKKTAGTVRKAEQANKLRNSTESALARSLDTPQSSSSTPRASGDSTTHGRARKSQ